MCLVISAFIPGTSRTNLRDIYLLRNVATAIPIVYFVAIIKLLSEPSSLAPIFQWRRGLKTKKKAVFSSVNKEKIYQNTELKEDSAKTRN